VHQSLLFQHTGKDGIQISGASPMNRTTTLLLAAVASAATLKLIAKTQAQGTDVILATAKMVRNDMLALEAHVNATGIDVGQNPLFHMVQHDYPSAGPLATLPA